MGTDKYGETRSKQMQLAAIIEATVRSMPDDCVLMIEFTEQSYRTPVVDAMTNKHGASFVRLLDAEREPPSMKFVANSPLFIDIVHYKEAAVYWDWLQETVRWWVEENKKPVIVFVPYVSELSHELYSTHTRATSFGIDEVI